MLVLTRKPGQSIKIEPDEGLRPTTPVGRLFADGPMEIVVLRVERNQVKIGITAHSGLKILREELDTKVREGSPDYAAG